jgi:hypothetical protein
VIRFEACAKENPEIGTGMENHIQGSKNGGDDEMVVFFGGTCQGAIEDSKHLKLSMKSLATEMMKSKIRA